MKNIRGIILTLAVVTIGLSVYAQQPQKDKYQKTFLENFKRAKSKYFRYHNSEKGGEMFLKSGVFSPGEPKEKILSLRINPEDRPGAGHGPEISSKNYTHFGTYAARIKIPDVKNIQPNVGAVVGYFTYHSDSVPGLSEIDYEWLIADPELIYIGTWTGKRGNLKRIGRTINLAKGTIYNTIYRERGSGFQRPLTGLQSQPDSIPALEGYDASARFYTYGFDWHPDRIRWWLINPATSDTIVLWNYRGSREGIPPNHTRYMFNFWHTNNWPAETNPNSIEKPLESYQTEVDWIYYKPLVKHSK